MTSTVHDTTNDSPDDDFPGGLSPHQEREVTRLLADARHTEPMPDTVIARLDGVLADLATERRRPTAPVVDLAARRRTRRVRLLVAAAAVVAAGVALPNYLPGLTSGSGDSSESADSAASGDRDTAVQELEDGPAPGAESEEDADGQPAPSAGGDGAVTEDLDGNWLYSRLEAVRIRPEHFSEDVSRALLLAPTAAQRSDQAAKRDLRRQLARLPDAVTTCLPADAAGTLYRATYDGRSGILLVGPRVDGERRYDLFLCGDPQLTRSVVLPAD